MIKDAVSIVINFNSQPALDSALVSLLEQQIPGQHHVLVWENGADQEVFGLPLGQHQEVRPGNHVHYLGDGVNYGYAPAVARTWDYVLQQPWSAQVGFIHLANPDTQAHSADALAQLLEAATAGAITGPAQWDGTGRRRISAYPAMRPYNVPLMHVSKGWMSRLSRVFPQSGNSARSVATLDGSYMAMRRREWDMLGGLDDGFFLYTDDHDLCLRAAGKDVPRVLLPNVHVTHLGGTSRKRRARLCEVEQVRCAIRYIGLHYGPRYERQVRRLTSALLLLKQDHELAWAARHLPNTLPDLPSVGIEERYTNWLRQCDARRAQDLAEQIDTEARR